MYLNLKLRPLAILENLVNQKCLIPNSKFPVGLKPGDWCKCYRGNSGSYSICQVFPRSNIETNFCYLDDTVCKSGAHPSVNEEMLTGLDILSNYMQLEEYANEERPLVVVTLTYVVTEKLFVGNLEKINLDYLLNTTMQYLPTLRLTVGCEVQSEDLERAGIATIKVESVQGMEKLAAFSIDEDATILVNDVQLQRTQNKPTFYTCGFERAQEDLQDLLLVGELLKNCRWQIRPSLNALITGSSSCGKSTLVQWFIQENMCNCFRITAANVLGSYPGETETNLRHKFQAVKVFVQQLLPKSSTVVLIEDLHLLCPVIQVTATEAGNAMRISAQLLNLIDDLHASCLNIICLATTSAPESINELARCPGRFDREITIPKPTEEQRAALFRTLVEHSSYATEYKNQPTNELCEMVAKQTQGFVFADLELLVRNVGHQLLRSDHVSFATVLGQALKQANPTSMRGNVLTVYKAAQCFDSIGGMEQLKLTLQICIMMGLKRPSVYKRFGLSLPKGVLLYGPPGCGKTCIAKCIATEANMTFITASGAEVYSPYVGCAEKFIVKMFDTARKHAPCLIFFDEIDSLVGCRSSDSKGEIQLRILSTLLTEMDGITSSSSISNSVNSANHILVVAATNRPDMLDDALLRPGRFDKLIHVPAPDLQARLAIFNLYAQCMPFAKDVDLLAIAQRTDNYSGADICNLCNEAGLDALQCDFNAAVVEMANFEHVLLEHKSSLKLDQIQWYINFENKFVS